MMRFLIINSRVSILIQNKIQINIITKGVNTIQGLLEIEGDHE